MGGKARNFSPLTLKKLFALSGNQCSFPGCRKVLVTEKNAKECNICHIEGANPGGERYREDSTDKERAGYTNLILLCRPHHDETDDVDKYTVVVLQEMKQKHTSQHALGKIKENPSMLRNTINAIANINMNDVYVDEDLTPFCINAKLQHNAIKKYAPLIQEYKVYHHKIDLLYDELEAHGSIKKSVVLSNIKSCYLKAKGKYTQGSITSIDKIKEHSDDIIDDVISMLSLELDNSGFYKENIIVGIELIIVDAFMRCKILEKPE